MEPIVVATLVLAVVTGVLAFTTWLQGRAMSKRADAEVGVLREQAAALTVSAAALANSAKATQAMADEMLEARKAERPLDLGSGARGRHGPRGFQRENLAD